MSIVKITYHNENIFQADSQDSKLILPPKPKMYHSKFEKSIKDKQKEMKTAKHLQHRTFGFAEMPLPTPDNFLKKNDGISRYYERPKTSAHPRCSVRRPPIPRLDELKQSRSMQNLDGEKNFKLINIKRAKSAYPRYKPALNFEKIPAPVHVYSEKFGKAPKYLARITNRLRKLELEERKLQEESEGRQEKEIRVISQEDKAKLLEGLKHNWDLMQKEYQRMPLLIDTCPKMLRKTKLENNLKSLERDICLLNSNANYIYILPN